MSGTDTAIAELAEPTAVSSVPRSAALPYLSVANAREAIDLLEEAGFETLEAGNAIEIATQMRKEGFNDLRTSGLAKVMQGVTSLAEVNRVTKD